MANTLKMSDFKGTKGPWNYSDDVIGESFYIQTENLDRFDSFIGEIGGGQQLKHEIEANAKLVAASPELLEALIDLKSGYEMLWDKITKHAKLTPEYLNACKVIYKILNEEQD